MKEKMDINSMVSKYEKQGIQRMYLFIYEYYANVYRFFFLNHLPSDVDLFVW